MENFSELEKIAVNVLVKWYEETQMRQAQESKLKLVQELLVKEHRERCAAEEEWKKRIGEITISKKTGPYYSSTDSETETERDKKVFSSDSHYIKNEVCDSTSSTKICTPQSSSENTVQFEWKPETKFENKPRVSEKIRITNFEVRAGTPRTHIPIKILNTTTPLKRQSQKPVKVLTPVNKLAKQEATDCFTNKKEAHTPPSRNKENMVAIGSGRTLIPKHVYDNLDWNSYTSVTRKLLQATFSRETLSTHSLSGRPSPAFAHKPVKKQLNRVVIEDIVATVSKNCRIQEKFVRTCITVKCADEAKMLRLRKSHCGASS